MSVNFGNGFNGMSGMNNMMGMSSMGMGGMMGMSGNTNQYFLQKYGCEDCFQKQPYWQEYPKPVLKEPEGAYKPSLFKRILHNIFGG